MPQSNRTQQRIQTEDEKQQTEIIGHFCDCEATTKQMTNEQRQNRRVAHSR